MRWGMCWRQIGNGVVVALSALLLCACDPSPPSAPAVSAAAAVPDRFSGIPGVEIRFADLAEGRKVLGASDAWTGLTSAMQRASLMGRDPPAATSDFLIWQSDNVRPWNDAQRSRWLAALAKVAPEFERLKLPLPPQVLLVLTSGKESEFTPHTRANAVVLPVEFDQQHFTDVEVLAHELFHVATRHRPDLATKLYATIGFSPCADLAWPREWEALRIANHDAPHHRHFVRLKLKGRVTALMPLVVATKPVLNRKAGDTIVSVMETRLLEVIPGAGGQPTRPVRVGGKLVWHEAEAVPEYLAALGGNTDYSIHPEETMADNVMFMVSGRAVPKPELLKKIEGVLLAQAAKP